MSKSNFKPENIQYIDIYDKGSVVFQWGVKEFGFGETSFYYKDGKLKCNNEYLSKKL